MAFVIWVVTDTLTNGQKILSVCFNSDASYYKCTYRRIHIINQSSKCIVTAYRENDDDNEHWGANL